jgi:hypothetical protein
MPKVNKHRPIMHYAQKSYHKSVNFGVEGYKKLTLKHFFTIPLVLIKDRFPAPSVNLLGWFCTKGAGRASVFGRHGKFGRKKKKIKPWFGCTSLA